MGKNYFTKQQVNELKKSPYIQNISEKAITYSLDFKEIFMNEYLAGKPPSIILNELRIDPKILGRSRIDGIVQRARKHQMRGGDCNDTRKILSGRPATKHLSDKDLIARLQHKNEILKQENEFLKKIQYLNKQALWKQSKQRQKTNSNTSKK